MKDTLTDGLQVVQHAYDYAQRMIRRDPGYGESLPLYDTTHETCLDYGMWVLGQIEEGHNVDHSIHFWTWLESR